LQREAIETPAHPEFDPELDDFHTPATGRPAPIPEEVGTEEAVERETKRRRQGVGPRDEQASLSFAFKAYEMDDFLQSEAQAEFNLKSEYYAKHDIAESEFLYAMISMFSTDVWWRKHMPELPPGHQLKQQLEQRKRAERRSSSMSCRRNSFTSSPVFWRR
jgi:hypothetical protein